MKHHVYAVSAGVLLFPKFCSYLLASCSIC